MRLAIRLLPSRGFVFFIRTTEEFLQQHRGQDVFLTAERDGEPDSCLHQPYLRDWGSRIEILGWFVGHVLLSLDIMNGNWRPLLPLKWHFRFGLRAGSVSGRGCLNAPAVLPTEGGESGREYRGHIEKTTAGEWA